MAYTIGDTIICQATFTHEDELVDPATIICKVKDGTGQATTYTYGTSIELQRTSLGIYQTTINITNSGRWTYRYETTGTYKAAQENAFQVHPTNF